MIVKMIKIMIMMMITPGEDRYQYLKYIYKIYFLLIVFSAEGDLFLFVPWVRGLGEEARYFFSTVGERWLSSW